MARKAAPTKSKIGRPSDYREEFTRIARSLCLLGAKNTEIAAALGVNPSTLDRWMSEKIELREAVKEGRLHADAVVASSLFRNATGFTGPDGKYHWPETVAQIFWLKNRRPDLWRDAHRHEVTGKDGAQVYREVDVAMKSAAAELKVWREETVT